VLRNARPPAHYLKNYQEQFEPWRSKRAPIYRSPRQPSPGKESARRRWLYWQWQALRPISDVWFGLEQLKQLRFGLSGAVLPLFDRGLKCADPIFGRLKLKGCLQPGDKVTGLIHWSAAAHFLWCKLAYFFRYIDRVLRHGCWFGIIPNATERLRILLLRVMSRGNAPGC
jgi:hypothetical protein